MPDLYILSGFNYKTPKKCLLAVLLDIHHPYIICWLCHHFNTSPYFQT